MAPVGTTACWATPTPAPTGRGLPIAWTLENSVYLAEGEAGRGIGTALLGELIGLTTALGYRQMVAVIGDSGNAGSIALHRRHGFHEAGLLRSVGWKHGRWIDSVLMQRALGPGDTASP